MLSYRKTIPMHPAFTHLEHRPWPVPASPWVWRQTWNHLLFAHWPIPAEQLSALVPEWLKIQEHSGSSWVGVIPFTMTGVTLRGVPNLPWLSHFPEMNLRLYVERDGKPGVWFVSLDAARRPAVWAARRFAHLPYFLSRMRVNVVGDQVSYQSNRRSNARVSLNALYAPTGPVGRSQRGSLEHFLTERYCLYTEDRPGRGWRLEIHHEPWPLQPAAAKFTVNEVAQPQGIALPASAPLLHYSRRLDVVGWRLERVT